MRAAARTDNANDPQREQLRGLVDTVLGLLVGCDPPDARHPTRPPLVRLGERMGAHAVMWCEPERSAEGRIRVRGQFCDGRALRVFHFDVHPGELEHPDAALALLMDRTLAQLGLWVTDPGEAWLRLGAWRDGRIAAEPPSPSTPRGDDGARGLAATSDRREDEAPVVP